MKMHLLHLLLIAVAALPLCSCSTADDLPRDVPQSGSSKHDADVDGETPQEQGTSNKANPYADIPDNRPVVHRVGAGQPGDDGWCLARPTRGSFSALLPGEFVDSMTKSTTKTGGTGVMHTVATKTAEGVEFSVLETEIVGERPAGSPVDLMIDRFQQLGATVTREETTLADRPAVRLRVKAQGVAAQFILLSSANSDYMLAVQSRSPSADKETLAADTERFFASFKIVDE